MTENGHAKTVSVKREHAVHHSVDRPLPGAVVSPSGFVLDGWAYHGGALRLREVRALASGAVIGRTSVFYRRPDVNAVHGLPDNARVGFAIYIDRLPPAKSVEIAVVADFGAGVELLGNVPVRASNFDAKREAYGSLADPAFDYVLHREQVYSVGPPAPEADEECVNLILALTDEHDTIVDVGCGIGAYAKPLIAGGRLWHGCEVEPEFVETMRRGGLEATLASGTTLPFADASFDTALAVEVLEHIGDCEAFVAELARVAARGALVSVPNAGAIPRYAPLGIVPWHLLESSHVNFFTVASLRALLSRVFARVEIIEYSELPVPTVDGTHVYNHLFAIASHGRDRSG